MDGPDIDLVMKAKVTGDAAAFAELVRRHQSRLRAFLIRLCADPALSDDLAQETLMKAHRGLASFKGGASFRSWLFSIAYREFLQAKRKERSDRKLEAELLESQEDAPPVSSTHFSVDIQRALASLEELERASIILCDAAGFSHAEASSTLGAPLGSVKTYVARARQKMRNFMTAETPPTAEANPNANMAGANHAR